MENENPQIASENSKSDKWIYDFCRYSVAFVIIGYGWAKLLGSQFTVLDSELDKPLGEVSGFWLTWYYFGYSPFYGNLIAIVQIIAGFLLVWRKTVLLAACVLFGVVGNILLIDIFYGVDLGGLVMAIFLEAALFVILYFHRRELIETFFTRQNSVFPEVRNSSLRRVLKIALIALFVAFPPGFAYWVANFNNRLPTEIDGRWRVVSTSAPLTDGDQPLTGIYFERNRAFMAIFRFGENRWRTHHFEIDAQNKKIGVWERWLSKGEPVFEGNYELQNDRLILNGTSQPSNQPLTIEFERR